MRRMPTTTNLVGVGRHRGSPGSMSGGGGVSGLVTRDLLARQSLQTLRPRPTTLRRHSGGPRRVWPCRRCRRSSPSTRALAYEEHQQLRLLVSNRQLLADPAFRPGPVGAQRLLGSGSDPADHRSDGASGRRSGRRDRVGAEHLVSTAYLSGRRRSSLPFSAGNAPAMRISAETSTG
jgi:hypothetical protein